jgi:hypothetical protein
MPTESQSEPTIEIFFSYSHKDEELRNELANHLSILQQQGMISAWHDRRIAPGREWAGEISEHLDRAQIILLLVSADFLASDYCRKIEIERALERHKAKKARVIPVILRPVSYSKLLEVYPKNDRTNAPIHQ